MIRLRGVAKKFGDVTAIAGLDLEIAPGATTALIGPSGCGKSTLLRLINGLIEPDAGSIEVDGTVVTPSSVEALRRSMGYVIQGGGLFPHLTARDNVLLMARHLGWEAPRCQARLDELGELTHLPKDLLERFPAELSGGQAQRVALMRALLLEPSVLLLDEPMGALDPMIRADLQVELGGIFERLGATVVLVTHDLAEALFLAETVVLMDAGALAQVGRGQDLIDAPASPFVTRFVTAHRALGT